MKGFFSCLLLLSCGAGIFSFATRGSSSDQCPTLLKQAGASEKFPERVVHAIHAITLNDLKKFEPDVTEKNNVPTVNRDKNSPIWVLPNAPDIKSKDEDKFNTTTMKLLDLVLSHIDDRVYFESDYTLIEQIVHTAHMQDHRMQVKVDYDKIKKTRTSDDTELCRCVLDTENNGIGAILIAGHGKGLINHGTMTDQGALRYSRLDSHTKYSCGTGLGLIGPKGCPPAPVVQQPTKPYNPEDCDSAVSPDSLKLVGSAAWSLYKKRLQCLEKHTYDAALFLYCSLKKN